MKRIKLYMAILNHGWIRGEVVTDLLPKLKATKGVKGGFAIGGSSSTAKGPTDQYFRLKPDSAKFLMVSEFLLVP